MVDPNLMTPGQKAKLKYSDDGRNYIFPADEVAPGANFGPKTSPVTMPAIPAPSETVIQEEFINPGQQQDAARAPSAAQISAPSGIDTFSSGLNKEANALDELGKQEASAFDQAQKTTAEYANKIQSIQDKESQAFDEFQKEDAETKRKIDNFELKPADIFAGKETWQKIIGGIGMFLGSITPEGARNVQGFINSEIERDIDRQKQSFALLKDKRNENANMYKRKLEKYGSDKMAVLSIKQDALSAVEFQLKKLQANSKGSLARAKLEQGLGTVQMEQEKINSQRAVEFAKLQQKQEMNGIPGYNGAPLDQASKREFTNMLASADTINGSLQELSEVVKGTGESIPFTQKNDKSKQLVNDIQLQLKEIKKLGVLSGNDSLRLDYYISNPSIFKSDSRMQAEINGVRSLVTKAVSAHEKRLGQSRIIPTGARKI